MTLEEQNKEVVRRWEEDAFGGRNLDLMDELYAENFIAYPEGRSRDELKQHLAEILPKYPTLKVDIEEMIAEGNTVAARINRSAEGHKPMLGLTLYHLADGKIVKTWFYHEPVEEQ